MSANERSTSNGFLLLLTAAGALLLAIFFGRFSPAATVLSRLVLPLAAAAATLLASYAAGRAAHLLATAVMRRERKPPLDASPFELILVGVPLLGIIVGITAAAGWRFAEAATVLTLLLAAGGGIDLVRSRKDRSPGHPLTAGEALLLAPPVAIAFIMAIAPVNSPDELIYKLAVPKAYLLAEGMIELPFNSHSYFPAATALAMLPALAVSGGIATKLVHFAAFLIVLSIIRATAHQIDPRAVTWSVTVVAWTPALSLIAGWAWSDWFVIGLTLLSWLAWQRFRESGVASHAALMALAVGAAVSTKYTALAWAGMLGLVIAWRLRNDASARRLIAPILVVAATAGAFFYLRNLLWTGSPVAPFLTAMSPAVQNFRSGASGWRELLTGADIFHPGIIDDSLGILLPLMVIVSPLSLLHIRREDRDLFFLCAVQLAVLLSVGPLARLLSHATVPLAILGSVATVRAVRSVGTVVRLALGAAAAAALAGQLTLVGWIIVTSYEVGPYLVGKESQHEYIARTRDFDRSYRWIEANTSRSAKLLLLGETRTYYLERRALAAGNLDGPLVSRYLASFESAADLDRDLRLRGITHLLLNRREYRIGTEPPKGMLDRETALVVPPATHAIVTELLRSHATIRYADESFLVAELQGPK